MGAVRLLIRSELRRRWRSLVVVVLLVGFAGGATLAAIAGARRTATSFDRFRDTVRSHDALVFTEKAGPADVEKIRALPGVDAVGYLRQLAMTRPDGDFLAVGGPLDGAMFHEVNRLRIVDGRAPRADVPEEVVVPEPLARQDHLRVGDPLPFKSFAPEQVAAIKASNGRLPEPKGPVATLHVVGISRLPIDLSLQGRAGGVLILQRSFVEKYGPKIGNMSDADGAVLFVRLADGGAGVDRFVRQLRQVLGSRTYDLDPAALSIGGIQDSIDVLAIGILVFGAVAGLAGIIALGLIISRQVTLLSAGQTAVRDLGLSRRRRTVAIAGPLVIAVMVGALIAVVGAWAVSPLMPFGVAARAEPDTGLHFDPLTLVAGALAIVLVLGAIAFAASWRTTQADWSGERARRRPSMVARSLEAVGLAPTATIGVGMALEPGRGRTAVPVRSSLVGTAVAVLGVAAVAVFGASLDHLVETPHAFGINWSYLVDDTKLERVVTADGLLCGSADSRWQDLPTVEAAGIICTQSITLGGRAVGGIGFASMRGSIRPTVLEGRAPSAADEVAVGTETMKAIGASIGDRVTGTSPGGDVRYRIVGRVVVPSLIDPQAVADGAVFTARGLRRLETRDNVSAGGAAVVRFRPGVDLATAAHRIEDLPGVGRAGQPGLLPPRVPLEVDRLEQVDRVPFALAVFLTILGAMAVGHLLFTSVQRRRRDFAIMKTLGFRRAQIYATVGIQATTVAVVGVVVGLMTGIVAGTFIWRAAADRVGVLPGVDIPVPVLALIGLATVVLANLVALLPARAASRTPAAEVLRSD